MFIDTHSHLYDEQFDDDRADVLQRAFAAGAGKIFLPNINAGTIAPMLQLAGAYPGRLYPMMGLHPEDLGDTWRETLQQMETRLQEQDHPYIAIGEVGLDYYWDRSKYEEQQEAFAIQVEWAVKYGLPLMIHTRDAHREMVEVLTDVLNRNIEISESRNIEISKSRHPEISTSRHPDIATFSGVFHCFGGSAEEAAELLGFEDFMLGIGGVVTFKKSPLPAVLREAVPLERIVLETDAPYLAPVPHRGKRNETAFVTDVIAKLAEIYERDAQEVARITTENALKTFPKAK